ncbi:MAG: site-specific DNA-methyltransferase [Thermovenabulum sp.]|uniref:site-specific DNA-methyltransferase n=1 Tax=Thermovenabulum sp. TaxID=3100335 RepID=UPI003C7B8B28
MDSFYKFRNLLREIFQFDASDLDFGIYRILNYKKEQIEDFIENRLFQIVEEAFKEHKAGLTKDLEMELQRAKVQLEEIGKALGEEVFSPSGEVKERFKNTPAGHKYAELKRQKDEAEKADEIKLQVFNDLYNFFSRYYEEGDFVPQYRYSIKGHKYAIPYNGEEVALYWANKDQYYTKTGLLFRDYTFKVDDYKVIFRVVEAKEELGSNKATKERFFVLDDDKPTEFQGKELVIRFQYRELTEDEVKKYNVAGGSNTSKQQKVNEFSFSSIVNEVAKVNKEVSLYLQKDKNETPLLKYHLDRFTGKNTKDYFIHKDLKGFLSGQLDYYIKSEVLDLDTLEREKYSNKHIIRAKVVRQIGEAIIDFLAQIENFQKRLWEKKKFVLSTEYVITLDRIAKWAGEEFLEEIIDEILSNERQLKEWEELGFSEIKSREDLIEKEDIVGNEYKKLPIDTKYFDKEFKEKLLENITRNIDLDEALDGLLIKSENWQALNTILAKYKEKVQTIYIDPPFNKEQDADYLYNVKYKDSTWVSILENRLKLARDLLSEKGSIFIRCDYNGNMYVRLLMNEVFGEENFRNEVNIRKTNIQGPIYTRFNPALESLFLYAKSEKTQIIPQYKKREKEVQWLDMHSPKENPRMNEIYINGKKFIAPKGRHWTFSQEKVDQLLKEQRIRIVEKEYIDVFGNKHYKMPQYLMSEFEVIDSNWTDIPGYSQTQGFPTENSEILLKRVIESTSNEGDLVMDFFLGSGTTTSVAHKLGRRWIGVEMGEHFWTVILPRMKKVLAYDKSGISKENDVKEKYNKKSCGGFFKYQILEQYEDTLDNIELKENQEVLKVLEDEYLLKYFLDYETSESPYFLNIENLKDPFAYRLKVNLSEVGEPEEMVVDIPETFNYLLGLKIKKVKFRNNDRKRYMFLLGEKENKTYAVVWRTCGSNWTEEDFMKDKEFIKKELSEWKPHIVYVNAQSTLTPDFGDFVAEINYIEPDFKKLMNSEVR